jgi:hypothetical protein
MGMLRMSGPVRRALGRNAAALDAGVGLPPDAQCWQCGDAINLLASRPGTVTLSVVVTGGGLVTVPTFGHAEHTGSRVFTPEEFKRLASDKPSPIAGGHSDIVVDGHGSNEITVRLDEDTITPQERRRLLDLAAEVEAAGSDAEALRIMREATGLSMTDADADRAELERRAAAARDARRPVLTIRCPVCGQLPDMVINPSQAFCGNDDCRALQWDPLQDAATQLAEGTEIPGLIGENGIPAEVAEAYAARRPVQAYGSAVDDVREAETRDYFHHWGYRCGDGRCPQCGPAVA